MKAKRKENYRPFRFARASPIFSLFPRQSKFISQRQVWNWKLRRKTNELVLYEENCSAASTRWGWKVRNVFPNNVSIRKSFAHRQSVVSSCHASTLQAGGQRWIWRIETGAREFQCPRVCRHIIHSQVHANGWAAWSITNAYVNFTLWTHVRG